MKKHLRTLLAVTALAPVLFTTAQAGIVDLTRSLSAGTYTYYARGDSSFTAVTPFSTAFYPGTTNASSQETGHAPATTGASSLSFSSGKLTDGSSSSFVVGWSNVVGPVTGGGASTGEHAGSFYLLFDLGAAYDLTSVSITYTNASGQRWSPDFNQNVYTALSFTSSLSDFTLQGGQIFDKNSTTNLTASYDLPGTSIAARYVLLELTASLSAVGTTNSIGGKLVEVSILGDSTPASIPEPAATAGLAGVACLLALGLHRRAKNRGRQTASTPAFVSK